MNVYILTDEDGAIVRVYSNEDTAYQDANAYRMNLGERYTVTWVTVDDSAPVA